MASDSLDATDVLWDETTSKFIDGYAYLYRYDKRQRCTQKKLPGADWIYYVYDKADRLIFTQDGNQRASNPNEWTFSIPDAMGRTVLTGTCETYNGKPIAPGCLDEAVVTASYEESASTPDYMGYELANFTLGGTKLLSVDYYDSYDFITDPVVGQNFFRCPVFCYHWFRYQKRDGKPERTIDRQGSLPLGRCDSGDL